MHTITDHTTELKVLIHYNSDFSGSVEIVKDSGASVEVESLMIPGASLVEFFKDALLSDSHFGSSMRCAVAASLRDE